MDWINLHIPTVIRSPEFVGSSPAERGTWLAVYAYAACIECGGRLSGAALWKDRQWQQACGVTYREIRAASRLLLVDGEDVVINGYNAAKEAKVRQARDVAKLGAAARWNGREAMPTGIAEAMPTGIKTALATGNAEREREREKENNPAEASARGEGSSTPPAQADPAFAAQREALAAATEGAAEGLSRRAARNVEDALYEIRRLCPDLTPHEIRRRAENYRKHFRTAALTAQALAAHWARCGAPPTASGGGVSMIDGDFSRRKPAV